MDLSSFLTSLITSLLVFCVLVLLFSWLSSMPFNDVVYRPAKILRATTYHSPDLNHVTIGDSTTTTGQGGGAGGTARYDWLPRRPSFSWMAEAWSGTEAELIEFAGLDAAVYVLFLKSALSIFLLTAAFCIVVLLPVSASDDYYDSQKIVNPSFVFTSFDKLSAGNIRPGSPRLWCLVLGAYWLTAVTLWVLRRGYRHVLALRAQEEYNYTRSTHSTHTSRRRPLKPEQLVVLVRDVPTPPAQISFRQHVDNFFRSVHPLTYETCLVIAPNIKQITKVWKDLEYHRAALGDAERAFEESGRKVRPMQRMGPLGLVGARVDALQFHGMQVEMLKMKLSEEQRRANTLQWRSGAALVVFKSRVAAACAAQAMHGKDARQWTVSPAPEPRDLIRENLNVPLSRRSTREVLVYSVVAMTVLFYMVPIGFISAIISLDNLEKRLPDGAKLRMLLKHQPVLSSVLQAYLPQLALLLFLFLLPPFLLWLSRLEGITSRSHVVRAAAGKYFYFIVLNVFLGVTIAGTLFSSLNSLLHNPNSVVSLLSKSLPPQSTFFISFVALKFFVGYGMELCRFVPLIIYHLKRNFIWKSTSYDIRTACTPTSLEYATRVPDDMLILTIALCYAVIAPMILPFSAIYFGLGWCIAKNQILNVVVPNYESGGLMWAHMHSRILAALFLSQLTMLGYCSVKKFPYSTLLIPLPIASLIFAYICRRFYYPSLCFSPLMYLATDQVETPSVDVIVKAYMPEYLQAREELHVPEEGTQHVLT